MALITKPVTFTATVTSGVGTPTGAVQFRVDGTPAGGPVPLVGGVASMQTTTLAAGVHTISADYGANGNFGASSGSASASIILDIPALGGKELLGLAAILAAVAMLTTGRAVR